MYSFSAEGFENILKNIMEELYDIFIFMFQHSSAVIAEDPIADYFAGNTIKTIKIYVDIDQAQQFMEIMYKIKNFRQEVIITDKIHLMYLSSLHGDSVKLIIVCTTSPFDKIKNHYLSCCQSWYDGNVIKTTNKEIAERVTYINEEYVITTYIKMLQAGELFINDYSPIGYKIVRKKYDIPEDNIGDCNNIEKEIVGNLYISIINREIMTCKKVFFMDSFINSRVKEFKAFNFILKEFTFDSIMSLFGLHKDNKYFIVEYIIKELQNEPEAEDTEYLEWLQNYFVNLKKPETRKKLQFKL